VPPPPVVPVTPPPAAGNTPVIPVTPVAPPPPVPTTDPSTGKDTGKGTTGDTNTTGDGTGTGTGTPAVPLITLKADAALTYDPAKRAGAEFGPPKNAIDSKPATVWDVVVPADNRPLGVGLVVNLGARYTLDSVKLVTPTKGFGLEIYGAVDANALPEDILDKRWIHLTDRKKTENGDTISLKGKRKSTKVQLLMLYFTQPAEPTDPRVAIGDIQVRGTS